MIRSKAKVRYIPLRVAPSGPSGASDAQPVKPVFKFVIEHWLEWDSEEWQGGTTGYKKVTKESDRQQSEVFASNLEEAKAKINAANPVQNKTRKVSVIKMDEVPT